MAGVIRTKDYNMPRRPVKLKIVCDLTSYFKAFNSRCASWSHFDPTLAWLAGEAGESNLATSGKLQVLPFNNSSAFVSGDLLGSIFLS